MSDRLRLLFCARDMGAALNLAPVARLLAGRAGVEVRVVAQQPALAYLKAEAGRGGFVVTPFEGGEAQGPGDAGELLAAARTVLDALRPHAVLTGLSWPGAGVDEAMAVVAKVPVLAFQDFWGDVNLTLGRVADRFLVRDDLAARLTFERCGKPCLVVGSPKYEAYDGLDVTALREAGRERLPGRGPVAGFFGQPLGDLPGYARSAAAFGRALAAACPEARLLFAPHPKETGGAALAALGAGGLLVMRADFSCIEEALAACDVAATCFSSCGEDLAELRARGGDGLATMLYLLFEPDVADVFGRGAGLDFVPAARQGRAVEVRAAERLSVAVASALAGRTGRTAAAVRPGATRAVAEALLEAARVKGTDRRAAHA